MGGEPEIGLQLLVDELFDPFAGYDGNSLVT